MWLMYSPLVLYVLLKWSSRCVKFECLDTPFINHSCFLIHLVFALLIYYLNMPMRLTSERWAKLLLSKQRSLVCSTSSGGFSTVFVFGSFSGNKVGFWFWSGVRAAPSACAVSVSYSFTSFKPVCILGFWLSVSEFFFLKQHQISWCVRCWKHAISQIPLVFPLICEQKVIFSRCHLNIQYTDTSASVS